MRGTTDTARASRRRTGRWAGAALLPLALTALAVPSLAGASTKGAHRTVVSIDKTGGPLGKVLVDGAGQTLYVYTLDHAGHSACTGGCAKVWPPLLLAKGVSRATAGP